jgi:cation transporter-like permease
MKTFREYSLDESSDLVENSSDRLLETISLFLDENENYKNNLEAIDEGLFGTLLGGATGLVLGKTLGKLIAKILGIEKGLLYDLLTSKVVTTALGAAAGNSLTNN